MIQTWKNIILDLQQPISYLIPAITVALLILIVYMVWKRKIISVSSVLLIVYGQVLLQTAFFSREPGSRGGVDLKLFSTWGYITCFFHRKYYDVYSFWCSYAGCI